MDPWLCSVSQGSSIATSCGVGRRCGSDPALLWLWLWPAAVAPIQPLAWEFPYAAGAALKTTKTLAYKKYVALSWNSWVLFSTAVFILLNHQARELRAFSLTIMCF